MGVVYEAADDPVGLKHAISRGLLSYVAFVYVPSPYKATGISCVVLLAHLYSRLRMKRPPKMDRPVIGPKPWDAYREK